MATTLARQIQRAGTTVEWAAVNPVLAAGEFGVDKTLGRVKVGDGVTAWSGLGWSSMAPAEVAEVMAAAAAIGAGVDATDGALASALSNPASASATVLSNTFVRFVDQNGDPLPPGSVTTIHVNTATGDIDDITFEEV